jgi:hypothetical protein
MRGQLQTLRALGQLLPSASGAALMRVHAEVAASVAVASNLVRQAHGVVAGAGHVAHHLAELAAARDDARRTTDAFLRDFYENRIFEPYLRFESPEDERAYREREALRRQAIEDAKAQNTPEGELMALSVAREQLEDAGANGAKNSPDYQRTWEQLDKSYTGLAVALENSAQATTKALVKTPSHPSATIDADVFAALQSSGVILADQSLDGHGLSADASIAAALGRV